MTVAQEVILFFKFMIIVILVWCTENFVLAFASLSFISPVVRDFFIETKDIINWIVSLLALVLIVVKLYKAKNL